jgi:hypothetical protein
MAKKYTLMVENVNLYTMGGEDYASITMCTPRPEIKDPIRYDEVYQMDESITVHYNGTLSNAPTTELKKKITVTVG